MKVITADVGEIGQNSFRSGQMWDLKKINTDF